MEAGSLCETSIYKTIQRSVPGDSNPNQHCCENLKCKATWATVSRTGDISRDAVVWRNAATLTATSFCSFFLIWNIPFNSVMTFSRVTHLPTFFIQAEGLTTRHHPRDTWLGSSAPHIITVTGSVVIKILQGCDPPSSVLTLPTLEAPHTRPRLLLNSAHTSRQTILSIPF